MTDDVVAELDRRLGTYDADQLWVTFPPALARRARDEIVALRHYKHENHEASEVIRRAAELVRTQKEGAFSDAKREVRNAALEEAARLCDALYDGYSTATTDQTDPEQVWLDACDRAATAIRKLKDKGR